MKLALVFPGQGSQRPGMGMALAEAVPAAREAFQEVDDALSESLSRLVFEGSAGDLGATRNTQPALFAVSMAVLAALRSEGGFDPAADAVYVAGHSLGEYAALAAAGALSVADGARVLRARGDAMQKAAPGDPGAMTAVLGLAEDLAAEAAGAAARETGGVCVVANDNSPGQVVLSGNTAAIERAEELAKSAGARRAVRLGVAAGFHSPLMERAADEMATVLDSLELDVPVPPLVANVTALPVQDTAEIRGLLARQITERVRWRESVGTMVGDGVDAVAELGAGKVLSGLARRIEPGLTTFAVETPADVEAFLAAR
jgi:[acyl-carrier-protein] S-malonyltransferase